MKKTVFFSIFLIINAICWTCIELLRNVMSIDAMEAISWGELISFGTNKHPPLSGWLASIFFNGFGQNDIAIYLLGQIFLIIGFIYVYKLAKCFLSQEKAICSSLILCICFYYTYQMFIDNFNCNVVLMGLSPVIVYYFYKSIKENRLRDWILLGISEGLGVLGKYQIIFLFLAMFLYLICVDREQFKRKGLYLSVITGFLVVLPHLAWLLQHDFSLLYLLGRNDIGPGNTPKILLPFGCIVFPIKFLLDQVLAIAACIALYLILAWHEKNITINKTINSDALFLLFTGIVPVCLFACMGFAGHRIMGIWGSTMLSLSGIILFYFFPIQFTKNTFSYFIKFIITLNIMWIIGIVIFYSLQTKTKINYPHKKIMNDFNIIWNKETNNAPLKYVGGNIDYIFQFRVYNPQHPTIILDTFGHKNPWINHTDVINSGAIIITKSKKENIAMTKELVILLPENYKITPKKYQFSVCNKFNKCEQEKFYYTIISPQAVPLTTDK